MKKTNKLLFIILPFFLSGCAYVQPLIQDFNIISIPQEKELGTQISQQVRQEMTLSKDPALNTKVNQIGNKLVAALPRKDFEYQFFVVQEDSPNAFTIPGGKIFVHTGLMKLTDTDELAGVIGHEIGHAYERHPTKSLTRSYGMSYLSKLLLADNGGALKTLSLQLAQGGILNKYGRDDENEADAIGFFLVKKAGYPTDGLLRFMQKLALFEGENFTPALFRTHPPTPERIEHLKELQTADPAKIEAYLKVQG